MLAHGETEVVYYWEKRPEAASSPVHPVRVPGIDVSSW